MPRVGAFRYCRACGHDFEADHPTGGGPAVGPAGSDGQRSAAWSEPSEPPIPRWWIEEATRSEQLAAVGPGRPVGGPAAPVRAEPARPRAPTIAPAPAPTGRGRLPQLPWGLDIEPADRRTILLGVAIGALAGLGVVILMSLLTGPA